MILRLDKLGNGLQNLKLFILRLLFTKFISSLYFSKTRQVSLQSRESLAILSAFFWENILIFMLLNNDFFVGRFPDNFGMNFLKLSVFNRVFKGCLHHFSVFVIEIPDHFGMGKNILPVNPFFDIHFLSFAENHIHDFHYYKNIEKQPEKVQDVPFILER